MRCTLKKNVLQTRQMNKLFFFGYDQPVLTPKADYSQNVFTETVKKNLQHVTQTKYNYEANYLKTCQCMNHDNTM